MSVGFIIFEIIDKDSLKNQGINTYWPPRGYNFTLDIHLNIKVLTPADREGILSDLLDIHLKIKVLTPESRNTMNSNRLSQKIKWIFWVLGDR